MDINLKAITIGLILTGLLLAVGIVVFDSFREQVRTTLTISEENLTFTSGADTLAHNEIVSVTGFGNGTNYNTTAKQLGIAIDWTEAGAVTLNTTHYKTITESVTFTANWTTVKYPELINMTYIGNATYHLHNLTAILASENIDYYRNGSIHIADNASSPFTNGKAYTVTYTTDRFAYYDGLVYQIAYTYREDTDTTDVLNYATTAITPIASDWIPIVVSVVFLSLLMYFVVNMFSNRR